MLKWIYIINSAYNVQEVWMCQWQVLNRKVAIIAQCRAKQIRTGENWEYNKLITCRQNISTCNMQWWTLMKGSGSLQAGGRIVKDQFNFITIPTIYVYLKWWKLSHAYIELVILVMEHFSCMTGSVRSRPIVWEFGSVRSTQSVTHTTAYKYSSQTSHSMPCSQSSYF